MDKHSNDDGQLPPDVSETEIHLAFQKAIDAFRASHTPAEYAEISSCKSSAELLRRTKQAATSLSQGNDKITTTTTNNSSADGDAERSQHRVPQSVHNFCNAVSRLSLALEPYFACIGTFVQANPEISALVWGTLQFIFKLCRNYSTFVENLTEMLDKVTRELSDMEGLAGATRTRANLFGIGGVYESKRLMNALVSLYTDVLELFAKIRDLFAVDGRKKRLQAVRQTIKVIWVPFDEQFASFQKKFAAHRSIFQTELARRDAASLMMAYMTLKQLNSASLDHFRSAQSQLKESRYNSLKTWINPPLWTPPFEHAMRQCVPGTGGWVLSDSIFQAWSSLETQEIQGSSESRILFMQAKPGFGKSVLCGQIIRHEQTLSKNRKNQDPALADPVAFYFFDKQRSSENTHGSAIRALVTQLLHQNQDRPELIDLALASKEFSSSGELTASPEDLRAILNLFAEKLGGATLILDGLDECDDANRLLDFLPSSVNVKVLMLGRPSVNLAGRFKDRIRPMRLPDDGNRRDIELYVSPRITRLVADDELMLDGSVEETVEMIVGRSQSMFLWASLLVKHLESDMMSQEDRTELIHDMALFPELDLLYTRIIEKLLVWNTGRAARRNLQTLLRWLCIATRPLLISEIRVALALQVGSATSRRRQVPNLERTIERMTGSLVEIADGDTVRFIHSSVLDYFLDTTPPESGQGRGRPGNAFKVNRGLAHEEVAANCLSYLVHGAPRQRIYSVVSPPFGLKKVVDRYPFILYATHSWASHVARAMESWSPESAHGSDPANSTKLQLVNALSRFLFDRYAVTSWVELAWSSGSGPFVDSLGSISWKLSLLKDVAFGKATEAFSTDIDRLNREWRKVLEAQPHEIWEPSITAFMKSPFLIQTDQAEVVSIAKTDHQLLSAKEPILIASNSSSNQSAVGMIKLWPSTLFRDTMERLPQEHSENICSMIEELSQDWQVTYDIKSIKGKELYKIELQMPPVHIYKVLAKAFQTTTPERFSFPVAFSPDLMQITILGFLIRALPSEGSSIVGSGRFAAQDLEEACPFDRSICSRHVEAGEPLKELQCPCIFDRYGLAFSPSSRYLVLERWKGPRKLCFSMKELTIHKDTGDAWDRLRYTGIARQVMVANSVVFHPSKPVVAVSQLAVTALWLFEDNPSGLVTIVDRPLEGLAFSDCGNYVHGEAINRGFIVVNIEKHLRRIKDHAPAAATPFSTHGRALISHGETSLCRISNDHAPATLASGQIHFVNRRGGGGRYLSTVRQYSETGEVLLERLSEDGTCTVQQISRLPASANLESSHVSLVSALDDGGSGSGSGSGDFHLVLNQRPQDTYSVARASAEQGDMQLPLVIRRAKESVPRFTGKHSLLLEDSGRAAKRGRC